MRTTEYLTSALPTSNITGQPHWLGTACRHSCCHLRMCSRNLAHRTCSTRHRRTVTLVSCLLSFLVVSTPSTLSLAAFLPLCCLHCSARMDTYVHTMPWPLVRKPAHRCSMLRNLHSGRTVVFFALSTHLLLAYTKSEPRPTRLQHTQKTPAETPIMSLDSSSAPRVGVRGRRRCRAISTLPSTPRSPCTTGTAFNLSTTVFPFVHHCNAYTQRR